MMMNVSPRFCQIVTPATANERPFRVVEIGGFAGCCRSTASSPTCGLSSVTKMTAATATEVTTVDEKIVR